LNWLQQKAISQTFGRRFWEDSRGDFGNQDKSPRELPGTEKQKPEIYAFAFERIHGVTFNTKDYRWRF
jgi:hypothetical protein